MSVHTFFVQYRKQLIKYKPFIYKYSAVFFFVQTPKFWQKIKCRSLAKDVILPITQDLCIHLVNTSDSKVVQFLTYNDFVGNDLSLKSYLKELRSKGIQCMWSLHNALKRLFSNDDNGFERHT